jgi:hypothetical protein
VYRRFVFAVRPGVGRNFSAGGRGAREAQGLQRQVMRSMRSENGYKRTSGGRTVDFVVLPPQALSDPNPPPFCFRQQTEDARVIGIEIGLGDQFEERFRKDDVSIFVLVVGITIRVMNAEKWMSGIHLMKEVDKGKHSLCDVLFNLLCLCLRCLLFRQLLLRLLLCLLRFLGGHSNLRR